MIPVEQLGEVLSNLRIIRPDNRKNSVVNRGIDRDK